MNKTGLKMLYSAMVIGLLCGMAPTGFAAIFGFLLATVTLIYSGRTLAKDNFHRTQLRKLYFRGSLVIVLGVLAVAVFVASNADTSAIESMLQGVSNGNLLDNQTIEQGMQEFKQDNTQHFVTASGVVLTLCGAYILYLAYQGWREI